MNSRSQAFRFRVHHGLHPRHHCQGRGRRGDRPVPFKNPIEQIAYRKRYYRKHAENIKARVRELSHAKRERAEPLSPSRLQQMLRYYPDTGEFYWLDSASNRAPAGSRAGSIHLKTGYWTIGIDGIRYGAHRLAWLYMIGRWPDPEVDHKDTNRTNNRWTNLREATRTNNNGNRKQTRPTLKGAYWDARRQKWYSKIKCHHRSEWLGCFSTELAAHEAYCLAAHRHFGEYARAA